MHYEIKPLNNIEDMKEQIFLQDLKDAQNYMKGEWKNTIAAEKNYERENGFLSLTIYFDTLVGFVNATIKNHKLESVDGMKLVLPGTAGRCATIFAGGLTPYINYSVITE